jgi:uncharacterized protein (DUF169 family)
MQAGFKQQFMVEWEKYFPASQWPVCFYYTDSQVQAGVSQPLPGGHCFIHDLERVRQGESLIFAGSDIGCAGGRYYLGFSKSLHSNFNYFLSCGIPGELEGERYKESPELVAKIRAQFPPMLAPARQVVFKRWDRLDEDDIPQVVIFFAGADVISGLFTLAGFDESDPQAVIAPFGSGCSTIVQQPYRELESAHPHAVLGMFDVSARPWVAPHEMTLAVPWPKFVSMVNNMDKSFLTTGSWAKVKDRIEKIEG